MRIQIEEIKDVKEVLQSIQHFANLKLKGLEQSPAEFRDRDKMKKWNELLTNIYHDTGVIIDKIED